MTTNPVAIVRKHSNRILHKTSYTNVKEYLDAFK